jgi:hypothetical protein
MDVGLSWGQLGNPRSLRQQASLLSSAPLALRVVDRRTKDGWLASPRKRCVSAAIPAGGRRSNISSSGWAWENGAAWNYTQWFSTPTQQPDSAGGNQECVSIGWQGSGCNAASGNWDDSTCATAMPFVCKQQGRWARPGQCSQLAWHTLRCGCSLLETRLQVTSTPAVLLVSCCTHCSRGATSSFTT